MTRPVFATFTIPNVAPGQLGAGVDVLIEAFGALRRRALFAGGPCRSTHYGTDKRPIRCSHPPHRRGKADCACARCSACRVCRHEAVRGGVYALEVTYNAERDDWHPHAHATIDAPWLVWAELRDAWQAVTCDATRRAEARQAGQTGRIALDRCRHARDDRGRPVGGCRGAVVVWLEAVKGDDPAARRRAIRETIKYATKGVMTADGRPDPRLPSGRLAEVLLTLRGRRLVAGFGSLRGVTDDDPDALGDVERIAYPSPFAGLPVVCPACRRTADWDWPVTVARADCRPGVDGALFWHPPPTGGPH